MKKHHIPAGHFMEQFHNHHHYVEYGPDERRPEWWELPEPRARGGRIDFRKGGPVGYAHGGGVERLQQNLQGAFANLNQQVAAAPQHQQAAPAGGDYQAMTRQATQPSLSPDYRLMVENATLGKGYEGLFPTAPTSAPTAVRAPSAADATAPYYHTDYGPSPTEMLGGDGSSSGAADGGGGTGGAGAAGADGSGGDGGASSSGGGSAYRYGGHAAFRSNGVKKFNIVERALAVTRRK